MMMHRLLHIFVISVVVWICSVSSHPQSLRHGENRISRVLWAVKSNSASVTATAAKQVPKKTHSAVHKSSKSKTTTTTNKPAPRSVPYRRPRPTDGIRHMKKDENETSVPCLKNQHLDSYMHPTLYNATCTSQNDAYTYYALVSNAIQQKKPFLVGKCGATELRALMLVDLARQPDGSVGTFEIKPQLFYQSGVYPISEGFVVKFADVYQAALNDLDLIVEWNREENQEKFFGRIPQHIASVDAQWSWYWKTPYTQHFAGKTVLVISPFHQYIEKQYHDHRHCIFPHDFNGEVLPDFTLKTLSVPLPMWNVSISRAAQPETFRGRTWLTALDEMKSEIRGTDFDIAVIGAGAFGLPLGAEVKRLGKVGIVLGGNVGPLFGIKGHRFDSRMQYKSFYYNECWVRMEKPAGADKMEKAAYWRH